MVLLIAFLLLVVTAGLLLKAAMNSANVTDATAEQQAYNAAESGPQRTLDVLRGNVVPSVLLDGSKPAGDIKNKIDYTKAVVLSTSNLPNDNSTGSRLSRWIAYDPVKNDRVALGPDVNNEAYSIEVIDPDGTGAVITFNTSGDIDGGGSSYTVGSGGNTARISFVGRTVSNLNVASGPAATNLGRFVVSTTGSGATITDDIRFSVLFRMTVPYGAVRELRGTIKAGTLTPVSVGTVQIRFDSLKSELMGSERTLPGTTLNPNPPSTNAGEKTVDVTISSAEPVRLLVRSTGYGPRGAKKQLEAIVRKSLFDGLRASATLMLVGGTPSFQFEPGNSQNVAYSGEDVAVSNTIIPAIGTTNDTNLGVVEAAVDLAGKFKGDVTGPPANVSAEMSYWLRSPANLDAIIRSLRDQSQLAGRYYPRGVSPPNYGDNVTGTGITFCDGDCSLAGAGGGLLIVTGSLTLRGNFNFNGMIIVTGTQGLLRNGGGNGTLQGHAVVAPYDPANLPLALCRPNMRLQEAGSRRSHTIRTVSQMVWSP